MAASTTTVSIGPAVRAACSALLQKLDRLRAQLQLAPTEPGTQVLERAGLQELEAEAGAASAEDQKQYSTYSFGAVFAEVHVDPDFGTVRVARIVGAYDAGRILNPRLAHSQCIGGMVQGIGMAMLEETAWDERFGRVLNANIAEYLIPVCADVHSLEAVFVPGADTVLSPLGSKGLAELGLCGVAPALANAVWHATGKRVRELPISPGKLLVP